MTSTDQFDKITSLEDWVEDGTWRHAVKLKRVRRLPWKPLSSA